MTMATTARLRLHRRPPHHKKKTFTPMQWYTPKPFHPDPTPNNAIRYSDDPRLQPKKPCTPKPPRPHTLPIPLERTFLLPSDPKNLAKKQVHTPSMERKSKKGRIDRPTTTTATKPKDTLLEGIIARMQEVHAETPPKFMPTVPAKIPGPPKKVNPPKQPKRNKPPPKTARQTSMKSQPDPCCKKQKLTRPAFKPCPRLNTIPQQQTGPHDSY